MRGAMDGGEQWHRTEMPRRHAPQFATISTTSVGARGIPSCQSTSPSTCENSDHIMVSVYHLALVSPPPTHAWVSSVTLFQAAKDKGISDGAEAAPVEEDSLADAGGEFPSRLAPL